MSYFETVQDNMKITKILNKYKNFDKFYYNVKSIINSPEFKKSGSGFVSNNYPSAYSYHRKIQHKNVTVYVNSGFLCTSVSLYQEYYRGIQCTSIVQRHKAEKSDGLYDSTGRVSDSKSITLDKDDSSINNPLNPSNPMSW